MTNITIREREILELLSKGLQNKSIAHELGLTENTVKAHMGNILRKYGVHNRVQAMNRYLGRDQ
jgi:DNA-binding NarL/FixJ family response regulator